MYTWGVQINVPDCKVNTKVFLLRKVKTYLVTSFIYEHSISRETFNITTKRMALSNESKTIKCNYFPFEFFFWFLLNRTEIKLLQASDANEVPINSHIWVALTTFKQL